MGRDDVREAVDGLAAEIYWFDDTGRGGVRVPASWRLLYKAGDRLETGRDKGYASAWRSNAWNAVAFTPVTTTALRHRAGDAARVLGRRAGVEE